MIFEYLEYAKSGSLRLLRKERGAKTAIAVDGLVFEMFDIQNLGNKKMSSVLIELIIGTPLKHVKL